MANGDMVIYRNRGQIADIILNRPDKLNAMDKDMVKGLNQAWVRFNADSEARVAIVSSSNDKAFCSGADLNELLSGKPTPLGPSMPGIGIEVWKPIIAAINGYCLGAGLVLAMLSDIRIASDDALFAYPEARVGQTGGVGTALPKYIPAGLALELLLTAERINAERAYQIGFVNKIAPKQELMGEANKIAEIIAGNAPLVVSALKKLTYMSLHPNIIETGALGSRILSPLPLSEDAKEGPQAILEKRKPIFKGI